MNTATRTKEQFMQALRGIPTHIVAWAVSGNGVNWRGCSKSHIAEAWAAGPTDPRHNKIRLDIDEIQMRCDQEILNKLPNLVRRTVLWIAHNDNNGDDHPGNPDAERNVAGYMTTLLAADVLAWTPQALASHVMRARRIDAAKK